MLIKYEILKIVKKKSTLITMIISLMVTALLFALPAIGFQTYNKGGVIKGAAGIAYQKAEYEELSGELTNEYVTDAIREYQRLFENPDNVGTDGNESFLIGDAYWDFVAPRTQLLNLIGATFDNPDEYRGYETLLEIDLENNIDFYGKRNEKIEKLLNSPHRELSENQQAFWRNMNEPVETPFMYGYHESWSTILSSMELLMFAILAIAIVIAPVFAGEHQAGTDSIILSAKYGKSKLITAKILSSFIFAAIAFTLHIFVAIGIPIAAFGIDGWNLPIQIANTVIPYSWTFLKATAISLIVVYLIMFAIVSLTLLLSSRLTSSYLVLIVIVPLLFISLFLSPSATTGAYNLTVFLLPYRGLMPEFSQYISYQIGNVPLDAFMARLAVYGAITLIAIPFTRMIWKKKQIT